MMDMEICPCTVCLNKRPLGGNLEDVCNGKHHHYGEDHQNKIMATIISVLGE